MCPDKLRLDFLSALQTCTCVNGYFYNYNQSTGEGNCTEIISTFQQHKAVIVAVTASSSGLLLVLLVLSMLLWAFKAHFTAFALSRAKKRGPPGACL